MKRIISLCVIFCLCMTFVIHTQAAETKVIISADEQIIEASGTKTFSFTLPEAGEYVLRLWYRPIMGTHDIPEIGVTFDKPYNADKDKTFQLRRVYSYIYENGHLPQDDYGNDQIPNQTEVDTWQTKDLRPEEVQGYKLSAGAHQLTVTGVAGSVSLREIVLYLAQDAVSYEKYRAEFPKAEKGNFYHQQEAELLHKKNDLNISLSYDRSTPNISPNSPNKIRYNLLAGSTFSRHGQWVSWLFDIPEDGWYNFDFYYRQNVIEDMAVHRKVKINGEVLFRELEDVTFPASGNIAVKTLGNNDEEFMLYLQKGKCELSLEVNLEPSQKIISTFEKVIKELNMLSNRINVIIGETVDLFRDYDLEKAIPDLTDILHRNAAALEDTESLFGKDNAGEYMARINEAVRILNKMADSPRDIPKNLEYFRSQTASLSNILGGLMTQPLELDRIVLRSAGVSAPKANADGFLSVLFFRLKAFLGSFIEDYSSIGGSGETNHLNVWVNTGDAATNGFSSGREHAQIINELILGSYSSDSGTKVNLSLVSASETLMQAIASGKGPDAALFIPKDLVAKLYFRDALVPLNQKENIETIKSRFDPSSMVALEMDGKLFALPEIQMYQMLFYRTDIFEAHGLEIPNTWDKFYHVIKQLQIEQMQTGIAESTSVFEMLLLQSGGTLYNEDCSKTRLTEQSAVKAFTQWTELYSKYKLPLSFDMLNRFRSGQMPLMMAPLSFYSQLVMAAPELQGQWEMAPIPATEKDGVLNRSQPSIISGAIAVQQSKKTDYSEALNFLDWWTSAETQIKFAQASETRIGLAARYFPANKEAFSSVMWTGKERSALETQFKSVWDIPQTPATYYVQRNLLNAFRKVTYKGENPRDVIYRYGQEISNELTRKRQELGLEVKP